MNYLVLGSMRPEITTDWMRQAEMFYMGLWPEYSTWKVRWKRPLWRLTRWALLKYIWGLYNFQIPIAYTSTSLGSSLIAAISVPGMNYLPHEFTNFHESDLILRRSSPAFLPQTETLGLPIVI